MKEEKLKVAVYLRVYNDSEELMKEQEKIVEEYCKQNNYEITLIEKDYETKENTLLKGGLEQLFDYVQGYPEIFLIIIKDLSILSNNAEQIYDYYKYADEYCHCDIETVENGQNVKFEINVIRGENTWTMKKR